MSYTDIIKQLKEVQEPTKYSRKLANSPVLSEHQNTMLQWAVWIRREDDAALLLKHGAEVNAIDINGLTALHAVAMNERADMEGGGFKSGSRGYAITMLLLEHGADYGARDHAGWLPERYALESKPREKPNTEDYQDFLAVIETFKARYPEKQRHSSDETARDSDERDSLLGTETRRASSSANKPEVPFSLVGAVSSFISNAFGPAEKPARYKN